MLSWAGVPAFQRSGLSVSLLIQSDQVNEPQGLPRVPGTSRRGRGYVPLVYKWRLVLQEVDCSNVEVA